MAGGCAVWTSPEIPGDIFHVVAEQQSHIFDVQSRELVFESAREGHFGSPWLCVFENLHVHGCDCLAAAQAAVEGTSEGPPIMSCVQVVSLLQPCSVQHMVRRRFPT